MESNLSPKSIYQESYLGLTNIRCREVYYPENIADTIEESMREGYDILNLIHIDPSQTLGLTSTKHHIYQKTSTIRIDLQPSETVVLERFSATLRNHCRNGIESSDLSFKIYQPSQDQILEFYRNLQVFYFQKLKIDTDLSFHQRHHYLLQQCGSLFYSDTFFKGSLIKRHSYLTNRKLARLLNSIQINQNLLDLDKKTGGFSNTASHFHDMIFFKKNGCLVYDLGGVYSDMRDGVSQYKSKFSKSITNLYDVFLPISALGESCMQIIADRWNFKDVS